MRSAVSTGIKPAFSFAATRRYALALHAMANDFLRNQRRYEGTSQVAPGSNLPSATNAPRFPP